MKLKNSTAIRSENVSVGKRARTQARTQRRTGRKYNAAAAHGMGGGGITV